MFTYEIIKGIGNEVLLCGVLAVSILISVFVHLYNNGVFTVRATPIDTQNSNSNVQEESDVAPNVEDIESYEAGVIDSAPSTNSEHKDAEPEEGPSSEIISEHPAGMTKANQDKLTAKGHIILRLQYMNDFVRHVHAPPVMPIIHFKRKFFADEMVRQNKNVRLIFQGRELGPQARVTSSQQAANLPDPSLRRLCDYGVSNGSTIHCLISDLPAPRNSPPNNTASNIRVDSTRQVDVDIGTHTMLPLFTLLIGSTWIFRFTYVEYFNLVSTVALVILSGLLGAVALSIAFRPAIPSRSQAGAEPAAGDSESGNARNLLQATD